MKQIIEKIESVDSVNLPLEEDNLHEIKIDKSQKEFLKLMEDNNVICVSQAWKNINRNSINKLLFKYKL